MWNNWKDHWMTAFAEIQDINCMTSGNYLGLCQSASCPRNCPGKMVALLDNLANASIQKNDTIDQMVSKK